MQQKHIKEVKAKHKENSLLRQRSGETLTNSPKQQKKRTKARLNSAHESFASSDGGSPRATALPALLKAAEELQEQLSRNAPVITRRRNAVTIEQYSEHLLNAHAFDPAAAGAAPPAACQISPTKTLSFSLSSPTSETFTEMGGSMIPHRMAGRRRGLVQTQSASAMFRAASLHERKLLTKAEQVEESRTSVFARLSSDQAPQSARHRRGRMDLPKEQTTANTVTLKPLKMN
jgi:hypothetical protein